MKKFLENQYQNLFLWAPFVIAFGAAFYFSAASEIPFTYPAIIAILIGAILIFRNTRLVSTIVLLFMFGLFYSAGFTRLIDTPQITYDLRNVEISGTVSNIDYTDSRPRVFASVPANQLNKNLSATRNATIRVSVDPDLYLPRVGDQISAVVTLFRPSGPGAPNSFDYARWAYFNGLTATGYLNKYIHIERTGSANINSMRDYIHRKTNSFLSDTLVLGYKNAVPKADNPIWTATGVGHVWSISGFHMTLVSAWLFGFFYLIFRSVPYITRRFPARYPAMIFAWIGLLFYLFLSGVDVATVRSFLMTTMIMAAFLAGRGTFSMRNVCIVFLAIMLLNPHYVMQPGFQLSFSAIFGLIWFFGGKSEFRKRSIARRAIRVIFAVTMTSVIATIFTSPFVAYHFYSIPIYGLIGNLILLPVFSFAIMPLVMLGTITALFGWTWPLAAANQCYDIALIGANKIADLPLATVQIPPTALYALGLIVIGFLCLMFIKNTDNNFITRRANYILFVAFVGVGIGCTALQQRPLFYVTPDHELVGFVVDDKIEFNRGKSSAHYFVFETWRNLNFEPATNINKKYKCKRGVCIYKTPNWNLAYVQRYKPLARDIVNFCRDDEIDFIVSYFQIDSPKCKTKILHGGLVIYKNGTVRHTPSKRWWNGYKP